MKTIQLVLIASCLLIVGLAPIATTAQSGGDESQMTARKWLDAEKTVADVPDPFELDETVIEPVPMNYSEIRKSLIGQPAGSMEVRVLVDESGAYMGHLVIDSVGKQLTTALEGKLKDLWFEPAQQQGKATMGWARLRFDF